MLATKILHEQHVRRGCSEATLRDRCKWRERPRREQSHWRKMLQYQPRGRRLTSETSRCYRMVGSKPTLAFIELEIRQFASAFSISSFALAASVLVLSVMLGFNVIAVN